IDQFFPVLFGLRQQTCSGGGFFGQVGRCGSAQDVLDVSSIMGSPQNLCYAGTVVETSRTDEHCVLGGVVWIHAVFAVTVFGPIPVGQVAAKTAMSRERLGEVKRQVERRLG
ncbi:Uncharacterized protein FWK35_00025545, partial [Aphis craccivora]